MIRRLPLACSISLLAGCFGGSPVSLQPTTAPAPFVAHEVVDPSSGQVFESGKAIAGGRLTVEAFKAGSSTRLNGARVTVMGPTPATGLTSDKLDLTMQPLQAGTYAVRLEAAGYVPQLTSNVTIDPTSPAALSFQLVPAGGDVTGHIQASNGGSALAGARVSLQEAYAFSDASGNFRLKGAPLGVQTLGISKTGYVPTTATVTVTASESSTGNLSLADGTRLVSIENATQSFSGSTVGTALSSVTSALTAANQGYAFTNGAANADIRVVASPTAAGLGDVSARTESLRSFVANGGKLILMGEWGGFGDYTPSVINQLATPYGIAFNADLVQLSAGSPRADWPTIPVGSSPMPQPNPATTLQLFEACSLFAPSPAVPLASTGSGGFRVTSLINGDFVVAAARPYGKGLVVALSDTSAWIQPGTRGAASNLTEASNQAFILDVFNW